MKWIKGSAALLILFLVILAIALPRSNRTKRDGTIKLKGLSSEVTVIRDQKGMPYIHAANTDDLLKAQGFVTAQERLFQMELMRLLSQGRISELAGEKGKKTDIRMRTIGFIHHAREQVRILSPASRRFIENYTAGVNAFVNENKDLHPIEFKLAGISPGTWKNEDVIAILYFMGWNSAANIQSEILTQMLIDKVGPEKFKSITPFATNPDSPGKMTASHFPLQKLSLGRDASLLALLKEKGPLSVGSNNWVVNGKRSPGGKPVVVNDPHLQATMIPGPFMAIGLFTPKIRVVGAAVPGIPGFIVGRNDNCAVGVTNSYHDAQDLYIEKLDPKNPKHYLEGGRSLPFAERKEVLKIKDKKTDSGFREETIIVQSTRRGPVVSKVLKGLKTEKIITLRWSPFETKIPEIGFDKFLTAKNAREIKSAISNIRHVMLNIVYADRQGNIGWTTSGRIPKRAQGTGIAPTPVTGKDNWLGFISARETPSRENPARGWLGTSNQNTVPAGYPHYISSYFSPHYRYSRLKEIMKEEKKLKEEDHWRFMRDTENMMARSTLPVIIPFLKKDKDLAWMGELLEKWNRRDEIDSAGALCYQVLYYNILRETFSDELGKDLVTTMIDVQYFWQERFEKMIRSGASPWFDNTSTDKKETLADLVHAAGIKTEKFLKETAGSDPEDWQWGKIHRIEFFNPIGRSGILKKLLGTEFPMGGSHQTLYRAIYKPSKPFSVDVIAALRMVVDLSRDDRVMAVLPIGTTGRTFDPHTGDQMEAYMSGEKRYWWFSDKLIRAHKKYEMKILP